MMSELLSTSEQLLVQILSPQTDISDALSNFSVRLVNGNLVEHREFSSFVPSEPAYIRRFVEEAKQNLRNKVLDGEIESASIIDIITQTLIITVNPEPINTEKAGKFLIYVMVNEVLKLPISQDLIRTSLLAIDLSPSRHFYTEIDTPYISNKRSARFLEELSTGEPYRAAIETNYSYYVEGYEKASQNSNIPETILPNIYTRNYYKQLANRRDDLGQQRKYDEFRSILGLEMNIKQEALDSVYDTFYYSSFGAEVLDADDQAVLIIDNKNKSIIFNGDQISQGALVGGSAPLSLEVEFTRGSFGSYQELVDDEDGVPDVSQAIFENIERTPQNQFRSTTLYSTEYLENVNGQLEEKESPYAFSELRHFPLSRIFTSYDSYQDYQSLIITNTTNLTPSEDHLIIANEVINAQANINSRQSYGAIISGENSRSESLGYKISKRDVGGQLLQNFYIANGRGDKVITYRDAQVKYGAEYQYDLYEYRLIYGTQYKFKTTSVDLPLWMMENYLGLNTDAEERVREISNSRLQRPGIEPGEALPIPNITFNSYVEEFADPRVIEVPIYDDSFNRQQIFSILPAQSRDALEGTEFGSAGAISYPRAKVLDRPPTAPVLNVFPLFGIQDQVKMNISLQTGNNTGTRNSREIVSIGDMTDKIRALKEYQDNYLNTLLPPNKMEYKNEGLSELRNIVLYRTAQINLDVENYNDIYQSFDPETNSGVLVRRYTDRNLGEEGDAMVRIPSYDILDNIQPNINYYYTCIVEDVH
ncbi:MAG: hypothetical protein ACXADL_16800, partial [Candidatus Thorarchaeota archaeon]